MGVDIASLAVKVTGDGIDQTGRSLDNLTRSGGNAESAMGRLGDSSAGMGSSLSTAAGHASSLIAPLAAMVGITLSVAGAFEAVKKGLTVVNDYKIAIIGIASTLTDMAKPGQGDMTDIFKRNQDSAEAMYRAINVEAAKHFAGTHEMMMVYNRLVQSGYNVRLDEVGALGTLTDKIKLATQGQQQEIQLNQEVRALMDGQARTTSMLAMELQTRLGPGWSDLLEKHKKAGDLLTWLTSLWPGLQVATGKVTETFTSQWTTLKSILELVSIDGLGGAFQEIVGWMKDINAYLRDHQDIISGGIVRGWTAVKDLAAGTYGSIKFIYNIVSSPIIWTIQIATSIIGPGATFLSGGAGGGTYRAGGMPGDPYRNRMIDIAPTPDFGFGGAGNWNDADLLNTQEKLARNQKLADQAAAYKAKTGEAAMKEWNKSLPPVDIVNRLKDDKGGGGKSTDAAEQAMKSFIATMEAETARGAGDTEAILGAWYGKQLVSIEKWKNAGLDTTTALTAADAAYYSKLEKINSDFNDWYIGGMDDQYGKLVAQEDKKLKEVAGNAEKIAKVQEYYDKKHYELQQQVEKDIEGLHKTNLQAISQASPFLSDQLAIESKILEVEIQRNRADLDLKLSKMSISQDLKDQLRAEQAVADQAKRYDQERKKWETQGVSGGLKTWGIERLGEVESRGAKQTAEFLKNTESYLGDTLGQSLVDKLHNKKTDLMAMFSDLGDATVKSLSKKAIGFGFDTLAGAVGIPGLAGKPDGSPMKPFHVVMGGGFGGGPFGVLGRGNTPQSGGLFGNVPGIAQMMNQFKRMEKEKEDFFNPDDFKQFSTNFGMMSNQIGGFWQAGQEVMTAASLAGGAARTSSMLQEGTQGLGILSALMQGRILMEAGQAGAAGFRSVMQAVPFPFNMILAPITAAAAFAATLAFGSGVIGGGTPGGWTPGQGTGGGPGEFSPGAYHSGGHLSPIYAHSGWPALGSHEVPFIGLDTERVLNPRQTRDYEAGLREGGGRGGNSTHNYGDWHFNFPWVKDLDAQTVRRVIIPEIKKELDRHHG